MERIPAWLITLSLLVNKLTCGPEGYTLCARFYAGGKRGNKFHIFMVVVSDKIFFWDPDHCRKSYQLRRKTNVRRKT